jgi:hypothetical protein
MSIDSRAAESQRRAFAIASWENDGGAPASDATEHHYGRRVEADRSWTVHRVFTGVPAHIDGVTMSGLARQDATDVMLSLNRRSVLKKQERNALLRAGSTSTKVAGQP